MLVNIFSGSEEEVKNVENRFLLNYFIIDIGGGTITWEAQDQYITNIYT
jgi:hypothetical protein